MQNQLFFLVLKCTQTNREKYVETYRPMALVIFRERTEIVVAKEGEL